MEADQHEDLLRKIMDVERKYSSVMKNARSDRKAELKQLIDRAAEESEENAPSED